MKNEFIEELNQNGETFVLQKSKNILVASVNNIKVDFVNYRYSFIDQWIEINNFRMAAMKDVAAMKLNAISGRGNKKDFIDLYFLLNQFSLEEMMNFYMEKYKDLPLSPPLLVLNEII